ncbi:MAG: glycerophosphodiester phosphodiesterase [Burkholderiaceae bacterium]|jgi:glycerophosphoryl diester phosphodiesterase|nr:glycerophosphodiester phosphodiesterase [Burkholderiaceae bacterium]MDH5207440.1 glycerophosphodiester phosphodiesterase [Burkholderiaceae bacterium]
MNKHPAWPYPRVLAHRGGGVLAPENTLGAIRTGIAHGFRAVEFDAMLPADDTPILMHDPTLARTAGRTGAVTDFKAAELAQFDVGRWHSPAFAGEPVPTLEQTLALCRREGVWANVEIKPAPGREAATGRMVALQVARAFSDQLRPGGDRQESAVPGVPLLSSFSIEALIAARDAVPDLPRGWLVDRVPGDWRPRLDELGCVALHTNQRHLTASLAAAVKDAGIWLFCYTVNEPGRARELLGWGVDAFCTDRIDLIGPDFA